jgi:steroid 5-alpha reductase family enzyme
VSDWLALSFLCLTAVSGLMVVTWLCSIPIRNVSIVDSIWGLSFALIALVCLLAGDGPLERRVLLMVLVGVWGVRLAVHVTRRNLGKGEDERYRAFRKRYGGQRYWWFSLFQVFLLQGVFAWFVSLPIQVAASGDPGGSLGPFDALGATLWLLGISFEAIGDLQLSRFLAHRSDPAGVMDRGLWRYTRHPNYFGDAVVWWGIGVIGLAVWPAGAFALVGPAFMTFLLTKLSGVPMLERRMMQRPTFVDYARRTSAFVPLPPKSPPAAEPRGLFG